MDANATAAGSIGGHKHKKAAVVKAAVVKAAVQGPVDAREVRQPLAA